MISNVRLSTDALAKGLDVSLGIYNAFDRHYAEPAAYTNWQNVLQQDGRSVQLKLTYAF
jgi:outer membrane receptor protein involved in Fe transport